MTLPPTKSTTARTADHLRPITHERPPNMGWNAVTVSRYADVIQPPAISDAGKSSTMTGALWRSWSYRAP